MHFTTARSVWCALALTLIPAADLPGQATEFSADYENGRRSYFLDYWLLAAGQLDPALNITMVIQAGEGTYEISQIEKVVQSQRFLFVTFRSKRGGGTYHALVDPVRVLLITEKPEE